MMVREALNRIKIEGWRLSRVPIDPTVTIYQGDCLCWSAAAAAAGLGTDASGASFLGLSETTTPVETRGSRRFLSDTPAIRATVIQAGLVELICEATHTWLPFDPVYIGVTDAQHVKHTGANIIGYVDPAVGPLGKACVLGDPIKFWLSVPKKYAAFSVGA
jgi:hypothetical protein